MSIPHIVIIGGGAGGLELATRLGNTLGRRREANITLVDCRLTHVWKPLLHEIASGTLYSQDIELSFLAHAKQHHFHFQLGMLQAIDRAAKKITIAAVYEEGQLIIPQRELRYDFLILAVGSVSHDFGVPGVKEYCYFLDNHQQAESFHKIFLCRWLDLISETSAKKQIDIVIIGGGATGVELAAELRGMSQHIVKYSASSQLAISKCVKISILEASSRLVPMLPATLSEKVEHVLRNMDIDVYTNESVTRIEPQAVLTGSGLVLASDMTVWAAGIKAPDFLCHIEGLETNQRCQLLVKPTLQTTHDEAIFALGDCAACLQPDAKTMVPPRAQAAHQQASLLAASLAGYLQHKPLLQYQYRDYGSLVSISKNAVGNLMRILSRDWMLEGKLAKWIYLSLYQTHLIALHGVWRSSLKSLSDLFGRKVKPKLKLH